MNAYLLHRLLRVIRNPKAAALKFINRLFPRDAQVLRASQWSYGTLPREPITDIFPGIQSTHVTIERCFDRVINKSLDPLEILCLATIVRFVDARNVLEIGTYDGNTALNLAANVPDGLITTIDLPLDWGGKLALRIPDRHLNVTDLDRVGIQYKGTSYTDRIREVRGDSANMDWEALGGPFDLVFIDGCHFFEYVRQDTRNALRHLNPGGLIVWHDYGMLEDVSRLVDEMAEELKARAIMGTRLAVGFV